MSDLEFGGQGPADGAPEGGPQASEKASEQREKQREAFRKASGKLAAAKKDEKKTKKREKSLAFLLSIFIKESEHDEDQRIFNTLVTLLKGDIPAEFLMGILALLYPTLRQVILESTEDEASLINYQENARILTLLHAPKLSIENVMDFDHEALPDEVKQEINTWVQILLTCISFHPEWILPKVFIDGKVNSLSVQLSSFVLEKFLAMYKIQGEFAQIRTFSQYILQGVLQKMAGQFSTSRELENVASED